jgi:transcriptional regulator with XRE-family HTH domain
MLRGSGKWVPSGKARKRSRAHRVGNDHHHRLMMGHVKSAARDRARDKDLAVAQGVSEASIYSWENGRAEPEVRFLPKIIAFLRYCPYAPGRPLGERLRVAREARGLSRKRLARLVRVDEGTLWRWEQGIRAPKGRLAVVVDAILGVVELDVALNRGRMGRSLAADKIGRSESSELKASPSARPGGGSGSRRIPCDDT